MLPETEFHKLGSRLMFLVIDGRIYHTANSDNSSEGFLSLCGLDFPLMKAETLEELENRHYRKAKKEIEEFKAEQIGKLNNNYIKTLEAVMKEKEGSVFFFREICPAYNLKFDASFIPHPIITPKATSEIKGEEFERQNILGNIMPTKCAIINGRIYPLSPSSREVFVNIDNQFYELNKSVGLLDDIEERFQEQFEENLKKEAVFLFESGRKKGEKTSVLEKELSFLEVIDGVTKYEFCYEYGEIGYDFSSKLVYWLIKPHYNSTTEKSYNEGQSAVTLELEDKKLGTSVKFAERDNRNAHFSIHSHSNCYGSATSMPAFDEQNANSIEDKMYMLRTCAEEVAREGNFYTAPPSSDDSSSSDNSSSDYNYY